MATASNSGRFGRIPDPKLALEPGVRGDKILLLEPFARQLIHRICVKQTNRAFHTGAKAMERLASRARLPALCKPVENTFSDEVTVMGSTLAELAGHIQRNGGQVVGVVTLSMLAEAV